LKDTIVNILRTVHHIIILFLFRILILTRIRVPTTTTIIPALVLGAFSALTIIINIGIKPLLP